MNHFTPKKEDFRRDTSKLREEIERKTAEFLKRGGKITKCPSSASSGICDLPLREIRDIKKALGEPSTFARGGGR